MLMCEEQPSRQEPIFTTNEVLEESQKGKTIYYLPAYVRFKVKELLSLDIEGLQGEVSGTLLFSFHYGKLPEPILDQFIGEAEKGILLQFRRQDSLLLKQDKDITYKKDDNKKQIDFVVRQNFTCNLVGDVFFTPFQIINLFISITIQSVVLNPNDNDNKQITIKFNCMRAEDMTVMISHSQNVHLGNYNLANHFLWARFTNSDSNPFQPISVWDKDADLREENVVLEQGSAQVGPEMSLNQTKQMLNINQEEQLNSAVKLRKEKDAKIKNFQYVHFRIPFYQYPISNLVNIFVPLWVLGFINLLIFFQDPTLADRLAIISTLTLAFIAFVPTINEKIPQTPYIKLVEILVYTLALATVLCMIDSVLIVLNQDIDTYSFDWRSDGWFIATLIVNIVSAFIVMAMFVVHKCWWQKVYTELRQSSKDKQSMREWKNKQCDSEFRPFKAAKRIMKVI